MSPPTGHGDPDPSSLARSSTAVALADVVLLLAGLVTAAVTARWLGPAGKGALSALLLIGHVFLFHALTLGLPDASVYLVRGRGESLQRAVSASVSVLAATALIGIGALFVISVPAEWSGIAGAVAIAGVGLAGWIYFEFFAGVLNSQERISLTSMARAFVSLTSMFATFVFVGPLHLGVLGGAMAVLVGVSFGVTWLALELRRSGISFRPRWDPDYLRRALRFGLPSQSSFVLLAVSQRLDQLIVYSMRGELDGGLYSIALTLGWLVTYLPAALMRAAFPRLSGHEDQQALALVAQMLRVSVITSVVMGAAMVATMPFFVPVFFGESYRPSIAPAQLLVVAGLLWSIQWTLSRGAAARGRPGLLMFTLSVNLVVMVVLDYTLVPRWGLLAAGSSAIAGALSGVFASILSGAARGLTLSDVVPRRADLGLIAVTLRSVLGRRKSRDVA